MKKSIFLLLMLLIFCWVPISNIFAGDLPTFELKSITDPDGPAITSDQYDGKVVAVEFWTYQCKACKPTMRHMKELHQKYQSKGFEAVGIAIVSNTQSVPSNISQVVNQMKPSYETGIAQVTVLGKFFKTYLPGQKNPNAYPHVFLINKNGELIKYWLGQPDEQEFETLIKGNL